MVLKLPDYINELSEVKQEFDVMQTLIDRIENNLKFEKSKLTLNTSKKEFNEPMPSKTFEASRLILSQFKVFNFEVHQTIIFVLSRPTFFLLISFCRFAMKAIKL